MRYEKSSGLKTIDEETTVEFLYPAPFDSSSEGSQETGQEENNLENKTGDNVFSLLIAAFAFAVRHQSDSGRSV